MKATIETLKDALGNEVFRVSRIFPNASSAHRGAISLDAINPEAFDPFAKGEAFDPPEDFDSIEHDFEKARRGPILTKYALSIGVNYEFPQPPNCEGNNSASIADSDSGKVTVGEYMAQLQADSAEGDLDPRAVQAGIEGAGT